MSTDVNPLHSTQAVGQVSAAIQYSPLHHVKNHCTVIGAVARLGLLNEKNHGKVEDEEQRTQGRRVESLIYCYSVSVAVVWVHWTLVAPCPAWTCPDHGPNVLIFELGYTLSGTKETPELQSIMSPLPTEM